MTSTGATSAIVDLRRDGFGIVTDRDIRTKIVGAGLPLSAPVATVMTTPVFTVGPDRLGGEVLFELLERGIRHAPVVSEGGRLIGVVEDAEYAKLLRGGAVRVHYCQDAVTSCEAPVKLVDLWRQRRRWRAAGVFASKPLGLAVLGVAGSLA